MIKSLIDGLFKAYHVVISPLLGTNCRYAPSCSVYTKQAIEIHGVVKGCWLGLKRISRCHPYGGHGFDPVPGSPEAEMANKQSENAENRSDTP